ncbi:Type 1 glutamine amidotransferase-like domain-containing protein [Candidatus Berkelbacteria bacterium]|nr:Type 1 glutamine amidotransferase-like domain-containing protein [Candidatus Berkelbacteria bacterium]
MKNIAVYTGKGAYMAKDIEAYLSSHNFGYQRINENDLKSDCLKKIDTFIVGGGNISELLLTLKKEKNKILEFIKTGGKYIGICAGAYIASKYYYSKQNKRKQGLGIVDVTYKSGKGEKEIKVYFPSCGEKINLYFCNGPIIESLGNDNLLIAYSNNKKIGIIKKEFGKGVIFLFSAHPEGNLYKNVTAKDLDSEIFFNKLLKK